MFAGLVAGALIGATAGLVIGIVAFGPGTLGMWLSLLAAVVGGAGFGWFLGGIVALETPQPGEEPFESGPSDGDQRPPLTGRRREGVDT